MTGWYQVKAFVEQATALSMDALHIFAGLFLFLGIALLLRRPVTDRWPWLGVLFVTLLNEAADLSAEQWPSAAMQFGEAAKDVVVTLLLPTLILLTARHLPQLYVPRGPHRPAPPPSDENQT